ncbi:VOC family protein [Leptobacterium flavescens]|uniref:VOC family protein n=1 Tax=Leptobacterium flavescens TaxID=472055 RepID=A0A6P0UIJ8_9FLAO|nr:VOC family protein [Leptobacterium flavescens]NER12352.1 VOC family protein [Leptobacterium flavescens]
MNRKIGALSLVVDDYDKAIAYYTEKLGFKLMEDIPLDEKKRWVLISPSGDTGTTDLLLARAADEEQKKAIGNQSGGRVFLFLHTDNFRRDYENMKAKGVSFLEEPRHESYGTVVVFEDLYGNKWDLIEHSFSKKT